MIIHS